MKKGFGGVKWKITLTLNKLQYLNRLYLRVRVHVPVLFRTERIERIKGQLHVYVYKKLHV